MILDILQKEAVSGARHFLSNEQYERVKNLLPGKASDIGVIAKDNRLFIDAVLFVLKTVSSGVICRNASANGTPSISASITGLRGDAGLRFLQN